MKKGRRASERRKELEEIDSSLDDSSPDDVTVRAPLPEAPPSNKQVRDKIGTERFHVGQAGEQTDIDFQDSDVEITEVKDRTIFEVPVGGKLLDLNSGQTHEFNHTPCIVGRSEKSDITLLGDLNVSRDHLKFTLMENQPTWMIEDLGSCSGTLMNGELIELPSLIKHGDHILIGESSFRFLWADTVPENKTVVAPAPSTQVAEKTLLEALPVAGKTFGVMKPLHLALLGAFALGAVLAVGYIVLQPKKKNPHITLQVEQLLKDTAVLIEDLKLKEAQDRLDTIRALQPENSDAKSFQRMLDTETDGKRILQEAKTLRGEKKYGAMREKLREIPDSSLWAPFRDKMLRALVKQKRSRRLDEMQNLVKTGSAQEAKALLSVYVKEYPNDARAKRLEKAILKEENKPPPRDVEMEKAQGMFRAGDIAGATVFSKTKGEKGHAKLKRYASQLTSFIESRKKGKKALGAKKGKTANKHLSSAYALAFELAGSTASVPQNEVGYVWADALYLVALIELRAGKSCGWARSILKAAGLRANDPKIKTQKRKLDRQARAALQRAKAKYSINPQEAYRIARDHLCFAPEGSRLRADFDTFLNDQ